jgi:hypothetical protein
MVSGGVQVHELFGQACIVFSKGTQCSAFLFERVDRIASFVCLILVEKEYKKHLNSLASLVSKLRAKPYGHKIGGYNVVNAHPDILPGVFDAQEFKKDYQLSKDLAPPYWLGASRA